MLPVDDISPYIEAADEETLRRALRAVAAHLDELRQAATASAAIGESTRDTAHERLAVAAQAALVSGAAGQAPPSVAADAVEAYFTHLGFLTAATHISRCVNSVTAAAAAGLGLTSRPGDPGWEEPPAWPGA
ncbi:MAG TPA: hypothetical protein VIV12_04025 [Streptosporangiaceae bacterium]